MKSLSTVDGKNAGIPKNVISKKIMLMLLFLPLITLGCASSGAQTNSGSAAASDNDRAFSAGPENHSEINHDSIPEDDSVYFDEEKFNESMKQLEKKLSRIRIKFDNDSCWNKADDGEFRQYFDSEKFKKDMKRLSEKIKCDVLAAQKFKIDMPGLKRSMVRLKEQMKDLKIDMRGLRSKMKNLKSFMKDMRHELVKDGYIENSHEDFDMLLNGHEMKVNGEKLPEKLLEKYKAMYKEHFGKDVTDDNAFRIRQ